MAAEIRMRTNRVSRRAQVRLPLDAGPRVAWVRHGERDLELAAVRQMDTDFVSFVQDLDGAETVVTLAD